MVQEVFDAELMLGLQAKVLEHIAVGRDRQSCLDLVCELVQGMVSDSVCSVMVFDSERAALFVAAAPSVPRELAALLDGLVPCDQAGSCGTAVFLGAPVYVTDTAVDLRWAPLQSIAESLGIRACWSIPVRSRAGVVLGSFAISHLACREPDESHQRLLETASHLAGIAIERDVQARDLDAARIRAEEASRAKSDFLANMSHEIRTPLTAVLGFSDLLTDSPPGDPEVEGYVKTIRANANHLLTVIDDVLDISKIEAGCMRIERIEVHPRVIVQDAAEAAGSWATQKGLELSTSYDTRIPDRIRTDPTRVRQILVNLIGNAVKFTDRGSIRIHVDCDEDRELMRFHVIDTGIGMTPDQVETISRFEAFSQADTSTTREFGGTGLGLRISSSLSATLGGGIDFQSSLGEGSTFTATIATGSLKGVGWLEPGSIESSVGIHAQAERQVSRNGSRPLVGIRVLVAEDGRDNQRLVKHILEKAGAEVTICENGRIAVEAIEACGFEETPHLVLMDMQMPEMDGYAATRRLREGGYLAPIVALTAHAMSGDRERCLSAGCDEYQTKPIDRHALIDTIRMYVAATPENGVEGPDSVSR